MSIRDEVPNYYRRHPTEDLNEDVNITTNKGRCANLPLIEPIGIVGEKYKSMKMRTKYYKKNRNMTTRQVYQYLLEFLKTHPKWIYL